MNTVSSKGPDYYNSRPSHRHNGFSRCEPTRFAHAGCAVCAVAFLPQYYPQLCHSPQTASRRLLLAHDELPDARFSPSSSKKAPTTLSMNSLSISLPTLLLHISIHPSIVASHIACYFQHSLQFIDSFIPHHANCRTSLTAPRSLWQQWGCVLLIFHPLKDDPIRYWTLLQSCYIGISCFTTLADVYLPIFGHAGLFRLSAICLSTTTPKGLTLHHPRPCRCRVACFQKASF
jgi:hypothetical protein